MGLKSLFNRKKKRLPVVTDNLANPKPIQSPASSLNSRAQIEEELGQMFKKFDVNGDGKISSSKLESFMGSLGHPPTKEELENMIKEVDSDGDGFIDLIKFIELNTKDIESFEMLENLKDAFSVFDIEKNRSISAGE